MKITFKLGYDEYSVPFDPQLFAALGGIRKVDRRGVVITEAPVDALSFAVLPDEVVAPDQVRLINELEKAQKEASEARAKTRELCYALATLSVRIADAADSKLKELLTAEFKAIKAKHAPYDSGWKFDEPKEPTSNE